MDKWKYLCIVVAMAFALIATGCNTFKGMGKDIESAGEAIQKGADKTKEAISN